MNKTVEKRLETKTQKIIQLLNEMSAILPPKISAVCALTTIYTGINQLSHTMTKYYENGRK